MSRVGHFDSDCRAALDAHPIARAGDGHPEHIKPGTDVSDSGRCQCGSVIAKRERHVVGR